MVTNTPQWSDVELAIADLDDGNGLFFELSESPDESSVMIVHGDAGAYHIAIINDETEQSWLMLGPESDERVEIGGSLFPMQQVCYDAVLARTLVRCFFESGDRSTEAKWCTIDMEE